MKMDRKKALCFVQIAQYKLRRFYLGDDAGDERKVAERIVPDSLAGVVEALHCTSEILLADDDPPQWGDQAIAVGTDGFVRLKWLDNCVPA